MLYSLMVDASAVGCKGFSRGAYVGMMHVHSAINDISCCIIPCKVIVYRLCKQRGTREREHGVRA